MKLSITFFVCLLFAIMLISGVIGFFVGRIWEMMHQVGTIEDPDPRGICGNGKNNFS